MLGFLPLPLSPPSLRRHPTTLYLQLFLQRLYPSCPITTPIFKPFPHYHIGVVRLVTRTRTMNCDSEDEEL